MQSKIKMVRKQNWEKEKENANTLFLLRGFDIFK